MVPLVTKWFIFMKPISTWIALFVNSAEIIPISKLNNHTQTVIFLQFGIKLTTKL